MAIKTGNAKKGLFGKLLGGLGDAWDTAKGESAKDVGGGIEPGRYECQLVAMEERNETKKGKKWPHLNQTFRILEGDQAGKFIYRSNGLESEENIIWLQRDLRRLGVDVDNFSPDDMGQVLQDLLDNHPIVQLRVKDDGKYTNVYIDKLIEESADLVVFPDDDKADDDKVKGKGGGKPAASSKPAAGKGGKAAKEEDVKEDDESGDGDEYTPEKGDTVSFTIGTGKKAVDYTGEVTVVSVKRKTAVVELADGAEIEGDGNYTADWSELTKVEDDDNELDNDGDYEPEVKDEVTFQLEGEDFEGVVLKVDAKKQTATVKAKGLKQNPTLDWSDLTKAE